MAFVQGAPELLPRLRCYPVTIHTKPLKLSELEIVVGGGPHSAGRDSVGPACLDV